MKQYCAVLTELEYGTLDIYVQLIEATDKEEARKKIKEYKNNALDIVEIKEIDPELLYALHTSIYVGPTSED
jgi:hypothetical protein